MSNDVAPGADRQTQADNSADSERREALIKLGKYTAYAAPIVLASVSAHASTPPLSKGGPAPAPAPPSPKP